MPYNRPVLYWQKILDSLMSSSQVQRSTEAASDRHPDGRCIRALQSDCTTYTSCSMVLEGWTSVTRSPSRMNSPRNLKEADVRVLKEISTRAPKCRFMIQVITAIQPVLSSADPSGHGIAPPRAHRSLPSSNYHFTNNDNSRLPLFPELSLR